MTTARTVFHNVAGYSDYGEDHWREHAQGIANGVIKYDPHVFLTAELSAVGEPDQRSRVTSLLDPWGRRVPYGSDGRYAFLRDGIKRVASGRFQAPASTLYNRDTKQAAWVIYELDGKRAMDVGWHAEHEPGSVADEKRWTSTWAILKMSLAKADYFHVPHRNVLMAADLNSEGYVLRRLGEKGWKSVGAGGPYASTATFRGWNGEARKRFDYGIVLQGVQSSLVVDPSRHSDHARLYIKRVLS